MIDDIDREPIRDPAPPAPQLTPGPYMPFIWRELQFITRKGAEHEKGFHVETHGKVLWEKTPDPEDEFEITHTFTLYPTGGNTRLVIQESGTHEEGGYSSAVEIEESPSDECWFITTTSSSQDCDGRHGTDRAGSSKGGVGGGNHGDVSPVEWGNGLVYDEYAQRAGY